jgi:hypothetical protein
MVIISLQQNIFENRKRMTRVHGRRKKLDNSQLLGLFFIFTSILGILHISIPVFDKDS